MAGALCFATGGTLRAGSIDTREVLSQYYKLNPDFPKGLKGVFLKAAMNTAIASWSKDQKKLSAPPYPDKAAIIVFKPHPDALHVEKRGGFVNEVKVPAPALPTLQIEKAYFDDALLLAPEVERLRQAGITIEPLSTWANMVRQQTQPKNKPFQGKHPGQS